MGKSPPPPPDYEAAAQAQGDASRENITQQTWANRPNRVNPWGTETWTPDQGVDPATGLPMTNWTQTTELAPDAQAALDAQMQLQRGRSELGAGMMGDISNMMGSEMDWSQFGDMQGVDDMGPLSGMQNMSLENLPPAARQELMQNMNFNDPGLQGQNMQRGLDYSGASGVNAPEWTQQQAEKSIYDRGASRLDPQMAQESEALDVRLRSQGLNPGDEAYDAQMKNFQDRKTDAYQALQNEATSAGSAAAERMFNQQMGRRGMMTGEQDRMGGFSNAATQGQFGMDAQRQAQLYDIARGQGDFTNQARMGQMSADQANRFGEGGMQAQMAQINSQNAMNQGMYNQNQMYRNADYNNRLREQQINEQMMRRGQRLNEVNALTSGQQVGNPQFNNFTGAGAAQAPDYLQAAGMTGQHNQANYSAGQAGMNSLMGGIGTGIGMFGMSDRRLKRNIQKIAEINGTNWYSFDYIWGQPAIGVMADEVPHAAVEHPSGYLMVDYSKV